MRVAVIFRHSLTSNGIHYEKGERVELDDRLAQALAFSGDVDYADGRTVEQRMADREGHTLRAFDCGPRPVRRG
jgi:hypothetical protein